MIVVLSVYIALKQKNSTANWGTSGGMYIHEHTRAMSEVQRPQGHDSLAYSLPACLWSEPTVGHASPNEVIIPPEIRCL